MSWIGEATGVAGLLGKGWDWWRGRRDWIHFLQPPAPAPGAEHENPR